MTVSGRSRFRATAWPRYAAEPETRLHLYGKRAAKPGRKMGHVTRLTPLPPSVRR